MSTSNSDDSCDDEICIEKMCTRLKERKREIERQHQRNQRDVWRMKLFLKHSEERTAQLERQVIALTRANNLLHNMCLKGYCDMDLLRPLVDEAATAAKAAEKVKK